MNVATRIQQVEEYYFSKKLREIEQLKTKGVDVINAGIGSPDLRPRTSTADESTIPASIPNTTEDEFAEHIMFLNANRSVIKWFAGQMALVSCMI